MSENQNPGSPVPEQPSSDTFGGYQPVVPGQPSPYGQPAAPQQPVPPAYGQPTQPAYGQPAQPTGPAYGQPTPGYPASQYQQPYQQPQSFGQPTYAFTPEPQQPKSPVLGIVGLVLSALATIVGGIGGWIFGDASGQLSAFLYTNGYINTTGTVGTPDISYLPAEVQAQLEGVAGSATMGFSLIIGASILGIAGFIVGIVAIVKKAGKGFGIGAVILAFVGMIAAFTAFSVAMAPYAEMLVEGIQASMYPTP
ncbi:MAG: hypothetical protein LBR21_07110 [Propionibacteriaceae bacterium]|jgi:hypothetical protein|nr:hypothetical protein [Propionibacteriaceae bacterium]